ncbi:uncharacterized protein JCM10292_007548 [Rhodotorula paludigena]|uniref:uncharacterized protein n=1 Tax=Rhodotorula paludigena TaxID=86838 RepID=UPI00316BF389
MPSTTSRAPPAAASLPPPPLLRLISTVQPALRLVQNASAVSFSVFAVVHLTAPLSALLPSRPKYLSSAENRANGILLVGREVYQGEWTEPVLVWGSLTAHVLAGIALRWVKVAERVERRKVRREEVKRRARELASLSNGAEDELPGLSKATELEKDLVADEVDELEAELVATTTADEELVVPAAVPASTAPLFPVPNVHQRTGYLLAPLVLHHAWMHRLLPASPLPPTLSLSPSFFNYSFTSLALNHDSLILRLGSAASYAALTALATYHGLVGWRILLDPTSPRSLRPARRYPGQKGSRVRKVTGGREWQAAWVGLVAGVAMGTARIAGFLGGEKGGVALPAFVAKRMEYVLRRGFAQV